MQVFDETALLGDLEALPPIARTAFASATASRQLCSYKRYVRPTSVEDMKIISEIVQFLWRDLRESAPSFNFWTKNLDVVIQKLPEESEEWSIEYALADDALSSITYSIRCLLSHESQEAAWAARRAYEAVDHAAIRVLGIQPGSSFSEEAIRSHSFVQRELYRQKRDLKALRIGDLDKVQSLSSYEEILTDQEVQFL